MKLEMYPRIFDFLLILKYLSSASVRIDSRVIDSRVIDSRVATHSDSP